MPITIGLIPSLYYTRNGFPESQTLYSPTNASALNKGRYTISHVQSLCSGIILFSTQRRTQGFSNLDHPCARQFSSLNLQVPSGDTYPCICLQRAMIQSARTSAHSKTTAHSRTYMNYAYTHLGMYIHTPYITYILLDYAPLYIHTQVHNTKATYIVDALRQRLKLTSPLQKIIATRSAERSHTLSRLATLRRRQT